MAKAAKNLSTSTPTMLPKNSPVNLNDFKALETDVKEASEGFLLYHRERLKLLADALFTGFVQSKGELDAAKEEITGLQKTIEDQATVIEGLREKISRISATLSPVGGPEDTCATEDIDDEAPFDGEPPAATATATDDGDGDDGTAGEPSLAE